jgi:molybdopterin molybdotransferase
MDGAALSFSAWEKGIRAFVVQDTAAAGQAPPALEDPAHAIRVMTGGVLPEGCDVVVPVEWFTERNGSIQVTPPGDTKPERGQCIHFRGTDGETGRVVLAPGTRLGAPELAVAATEGAVRLTVNRPPRVALVTTGNEVVRPEDNPSERQLRGSHAIALETLLATWGPMGWDHEHVRDAADKLQQTFARALETVDILLVAGGVSRGQWDLVPDALKAAGVRNVFHRVAQRPGKPLWFGRTDSAFVFGLPGNPVSALCCARRYVWPALDRWSGRPEVPAEARPIQTELSPLPALTWFVPVQQQGAEVAPRILPHSAALHELTGTHGFVECPPGTAPMPAGTVLDYYAWSP